MAPKMLLPALGLASAVAATGPTVTTKNGTYEGKHNPTYNQDLFLGVPYAQPPLGNLRFSLPQPLNDTFSETRQATEYAPECYGYGGDQIGYQQSEDCLYVSITRPSDAAASASSGKDNSTGGLPVAVWIHGGGYYQGGSADGRYNLSFIVDNSVSQGQPIIGISIQYRLSAWGLLYSNQVQGAGQTNIALRDQRLALQWIQENIAAFGGDPNKVSIWGESAGGSSVGFHLVAYGGRDDGLFRGAVMESGNPVAYKAVNGSDYYQPIYDNLTAHVVPGPDFSQQGLANCSEATDSLTCLRSASFDSLNTAINTSYAQAWYPVVDGDFLRQYSSIQLVNGDFVHVPIISGANTDEGTAFSPQGVNTSDDFRNIVQYSQDFDAQPGITLPTSLVDEIVTAYPNSTCTDLPQDGPNNVNVSGSGDCSVPGPPLGAEYKRSVTYAGDVVFIAERRRTCATWAAAGVPAYCYRFNAVPFNQTTVTHFQEVAFVFDNTQGLGYDALRGGDPFRGKPSTYTDLAKTMSRSWASFFAVQDPNAWKVSGMVAVPEGASRGAPADWPNYVEGARDIAWDANVTSYAEADTWRPQMRIISDNALAYQR